MNPNKAEVYYNNKLVGHLSRENNKFFFRYDDDFLNDVSASAISLTLPKRKEPFESDYLFPFFFGLLSEGDNKELQCRLLNIDENDHFTRLVKTAMKDTIGAITVREINEIE